MTPTTETLTVETSGATLHVELAGCGDGAPLLLLHGLGGRGADWVHAGRDRFAHRRRLIVPDARAHGASTAGPGPLRMRQLADDLIAICDRLELKRIQAVGMSLGGCTLLHVATRRPELIDAMVLVSASPWFPHGARKTMLAYPDARARELATAVDDHALTPPQLAAVTARTLIVQGDRDELYPIELSVEMYRSIPRAALAIVPSAGHGPIFLERAEWFVTQALAFLTA